MAMEALYGWPCNSSAQFACFLNRRNMTMTEKNGSTSLTVTLHQEEKMLYNERHMQKGNRDVIDLIKTVPAVQLDADFTLLVMAAVQKPKKGVFMRLWHFLTLPRGFTIDPIKTLRRGASRSEMSFYFLCAAFGHLVLALVLFVGFKTSVISGSSAAAFLPPLLRRMPELSFCLAGWMGFWGLFVRMPSPLGMKGAKLGSLLYMEAVVISGALLFMQVTPVLIPCIAAIVGISVTAGIFLALSCDGEKCGASNSSYYGGIKHHETIPQESI